MCGRYASFREAQDLADAFAVGDVAEIVSAPNQGFLTAPGDEAGLAGALARLIGDPALRSAIGTANRAKVSAEYDFASTARTCRAIYEAAMQ